MVRPIFSTGPLDEHHEYLWIEFGLEFLERPGPGPGPAGIMRHWNAPPCPATIAALSSQNFIRAQQLRRDPMRPFCRLTRWQPTTFTTLRPTRRLAPPMLHPTASPLARPPARTMANAASVAAEAEGTTSSRSASTRASEAQSTPSHLPSFGSPMPTLTS